MQKYDASGEQIQCWDRHRLLDSSHHEVLTVHSVVRDLDTSSLKKAIELLITRHESLRTFFRIIDGELKQCIIPYDGEIFAPSCHDMSAFDDREKVLGAITDIISESKTRLTELTAPPLMRSHIFRMPGDEHYLFIVMHHIISDDWSKLIIYNEVSTFYQILKEGRPVDIKPPELQLRDYALWQKKWQEENYERIHGYWVNKLLFLKEKPDPGELYRQHSKLSNYPGDAKDAGGEMTRERLVDILETGRAVAYSRRIRPTNYAQLLKFSSSYKTHICSVIAASLQLLFYYLGEKKILIVMPVTGRFLPGAESLIGYLIGNVYLYRSVVPDMRIRDFIEEGYEELLESTSIPIYDHHKMQLDGAKIRLYCNVHLNFINQEMAGNMQTDIENDNVHQPRDKPDYFALTCNATEFQNGLSFSWVYNQALYSPEGIAFMAEKQEAILEAICRNPGMTTRELITSIE